MTVFAFHLARLQFDLTSNQTVLPQIMMYAIVITIFAQFVTVGTLTLTMTGITAPV